MALAGAPDVMEEQAERLAPKPDLVRILGAVVRDTHAPGPHQWAVGSGQWAAGSGAGARCKVGATGSVLGAWVWARRRFLLLGEAMLGRGREMRP